MSSVGNGSETVQIVEWQSQCTVMPIKVTWNTGKQ